MYSKLYARITESSLMEEAINVRYTFVLMLAIADPEGYVIGTDVAIARRLNMPLAEFAACLRVLMAPDADSNSKDHDGRRVLVSDGERGYRLVNYVNYRDMKSPQDRRDYMRDYMRKRRAKPIDATEVFEEVGFAETVNTCKPPLTQLRHADADAEETETEKKKKTPKTASVYSSEFEIWWSIYPQKKSKADAFKAWPKAVAILMQVRESDQSVAIEWLTAITRVYADSDEGRGGYVPHGATWLNGKRWEDDPKSWEKRNGKGVELFRGVNQFLAESEGRLP